jgi:acetylornithine deacetylase/succinyl-diaminopimelate desuccinylase-like protein
VILKKHRRITEDSFRKLELAKINTIAAEASFDLDLRSEDASVLANLVNTVEELISAANKPGVRFDAEVIGHQAHAFGQREAITAMAAVVVCSGGHRIAPVMKPERLVEQTGAGVKARVKRTPSEASRSTFGVRTSGYP